MNQLKLLVITAWVMSCLVVGSLLALSVQASNSALPVISAPTLTEITPKTVAGCMHPREFTLSGEGFEKDLRVQVIASGVNKILEKEKVEFVTQNNNNNKIKIRINTLEEPDNWVVRVSNGDGPLSNSVNFVVTAPPTYPFAQGELGKPIGLFSGVHAKSNGECTGVLTGTCDSNYLCEAPYQCVDYAKRYYKKTHPSITEIDNGWGSAKEFWERSKHLKLTKTIYSKNGMKWEELPYPGDMIFFDTGHKSGHVAIVTRVDGGKISVIQQNMDRYVADESLKFTTDETTGLVRIALLRGKYPVLGWLTPTDRIKSVLVGDWYDGGPDCMKILATNQSNIFHVKIWYCSTKGAPDSYVQATLSDNQLKGGDGKLHINLQSEGFFQATYKHTLNADVLSTNVQFEKMNDGLGLY